MTKEEAKIQRAIRAARIAKQTLLEETRDRMPLEVDEEEVKVKRPKAENVTIKVPNQDKEGYGLAGVEGEYKIKKAESNLPDGAKEAMDKMKKTLMDALENTPKDKVLTALSPNQRKYISAEEFTNAMVKIAKESLKDARWDGKIK